MRKRLENLDALAEALEDQRNNIRIDTSFELLRAAGLMDRYLDLGFRKLQLKRNQVMVLSFILANGGTITPTELRNKVFRSDNAISMTLNTLDKIGLTRSSRTTVDRRLRRVTLTEMGLQALEKIVPIRHDIFEEATSTLTQEESRELKILLEKIMDHLFDLTGKKSKEIYPVKNSAM